MKDAARIQSSIDLLEIILSSPDVPADKIITTYFRDRRFIGGGDRRAVSELVYSVLRNYLRLSWHTQGDSARDIVLAYLKEVQKKDLPALQSLFSGETFCPSPLTRPEIQALGVHKDPKTMPLWAEYNVPEDALPLLQESFPKTFQDELLAMNEQAPLDLRVNTLKGTRDAVLKELEKDQIEATLTPFSPVGIRLAKRRPLPDHPLWKDGIIEVQDEGSQLVSFLCDAKPGMSVLDYCAGAGGKSLALASVMQNKGRLVLSDSLEWRLKRAQERLRRAGVHNYECRLVTDKSWFKRQEWRFDRVLVDAPCSGTGTWRRNPDLKLKFKKQTVQELLQKQQDILDQAQKFVKPHGWLIYATCSLLQAENQGQIKTFLENHPHFQVLPIGDVWADVLGVPCPAQESMLQLTPAQHQTDGFFVSVLVRAGQT